MNEYLVIIDMKEQISLNIHEISEGEQIFGCWCRCPNISLCIQDIRPMSRYSQVPHLHMLTFVVKSSEAPWSYFFTQTT